MKSEVEIEEVTEVVEEVEVDEVVDDIDEEDINISSYSRSGDDIKEDDSEDDSEGDSEDDDEEDTFQGFISIKNKNKINKFKYILGGNDILQKMYHLGGLNL